MNHRIAYIAGPMRGKPRWNFDAFYECEAYLYRKDWATQLINPARIDEEGFGFNPDGPESQVTQEFLNAAMRRDFRCITNSTALVLLPGWELSTGARREAAVAMWCGLDIYRYDPKEMDNFRLEGPIRHDLVERVAKAATSKMLNRQLDYEQILTNTLKKYEPTLREKGYLTDEDLRRQDSDEERRNLTALYEQGELALV